MNYTKYTIFGIMATNKLRCVIAAHNFHALCLLKAHALLLPSFWFIFKQILSSYENCLTKFWLWLCRVELLHHFFLLTCRAAVNNAIAKMWYFLGIPMRHRSTCVHTVRDSSAVINSRKFRLKTTRIQNAIYNKSWKSLCNLLKNLFGMSVNTAHANNGVLIHAGE